MKSPRIVAGIFIIMLIVCKPLLGQSLTEKDTTYRGNILPTPSFTYSPETDVVIGAFALWQFKVPNATYGTRSSNTSFWIASSFKDQLFLDLSHLIYTAEEKYFIEGVIDYRAFNENYYGIGPDTKESDQTLVEYNSIQFRQRVLRKVIDNLFVGPQYRLITTFDVNWKNQNGDSIPPPDVVGNEGSTESGLGISATYDKRNSALTPTQDFYYEFNTYYYGNYIGGDNNFWALRLDARRYLNFNSKGKHVLALQGILDLLVGDEPFREFGKIGGKNISRGYLEGRFRDDFALQIQSEYRVNLIGRFGMTAFAGLAQVSGSSPFSVSNMKYSGGFGFRFNVNRKDTANARLDFGFSKNFQGIYIGFGEVF